MTLKKLRELLKDVLNRRRKTKFISQRVNSDSEEKVEFELSRDVTIKSMTIRFYPGAQLDLHVNPRLVKEEQGRVEDLVDYKGDKGHLEGDDDVFELDANVEASKGDKVLVEAENVDTDNNDYDYTLLMALEDR